MKIPFWDSNCNFTMVDFTKFTLPGFSEILWGHFILEYLWMIVMKIEQIKFQFIWIIFYGDQNSYLTEPILERLGVGALLIKNGIVNLVNSKFLKCENVKNSKRVQCAGTVCNKCFKESLPLFLIIGQLLFVFLRNYSKEIAKIFTVLTKILPGWLFFFFLYMRETY